MSSLSLSVQYAPGDVEDEPPSRARVRALIKSTLPQGGEITVRFVDKKEMTAMSQRRGKKTACDVLSFSYHAKGERIVGDIAVCPAAAVKAAKRRGVSPAHYMSHLVVHGALHLDGMHHDTDVAAAKMEQRERETLARFGIADPYSL